MATRFSAVVASVANAAVESCATMALSTLALAGRKVPVSTPRLSSAWPPSAAVATVEIRLAPPWTGTLATKLPSAATSAGTPLTVTPVMAAPVGPGSTVPVTSTVDRPSRMVPRAGEVTVRAGGSGRDPTSLVQATAAGTSVARRTRRLRMMPVVSKEGATYLHPPLAPNLPRSVTARRVSAGDWGGPWGSSRRRAQ